MKPGADLPQLLCHSAATFSRFGLQQREEVGRARVFFHYEGRTLEPPAFAVHPERARNRNSTTPKGADRPEFSDEVALELTGLGLPQHHAADFSFLAAALKPVNVELPRLAGIAGGYRGDVVYSDIARIVQLCLKEPMQAGDQVFNCAGRRRAH